MKCIYTGARIYLPQYQSYVVTDLFTVTGNEIIFRAPKENMLYVQTGTTLSMYGITHIVTLSMQGGRLPNTDVFACPRANVSGEFRE